MKKNKGGGIAMETEQRNSLVVTIEYFKRAQDRKAMESFHIFIKDMKRLVEQYQSCGDPQLNMTQLESEFEQLLRAMKNKDVIEMIDLMEYAIYPLLKEVLEA